MAAVPRDAAGAQICPSYDIVLPADLREEEIAGYLGISITRRRRRSGRTCFASNSAARYSSALRAIMRR